MNGLSNEQWFHTLLKNTHDGVIAIDVEGRILFMNPVAEALAEWKEGAIGKFLSEVFQIRNEKTGEDVDNPAIKAIKEGMTVRLPEDSVLISHNHKITPINEEATPIRNNREEIIGSLLIFQERRKKSEERAGSLGDFAGGIAHDLNNILSTMVGYPDLLLMKLPEESPLKRYILEIQKAAWDAASVVRDLLILGHRMHSTTKTVDLNQVIAEYLGDTGYGQAASAEIKIEVDLEPDLLKIKGVSRHLYRAVKNLITASMSTMDSGGILTLSTTNYYTDQPVHGGIAGDYVLLRISDTGTGLTIEDEDIQRIFEPFYLKKRWGNKIGGLDMAIVWRIVEDHRGYITVENATGEGTTFLVYFPAIREEQPAMDSYISIEEYMGHGERIVVVDDLATQREILSEMLANLGYSVHSAVSGEEAVEYLETHQTDLVILDMIMDPGIDGLETYKRILQIHPQQKAIIASGFAEAERVKEAMALGVGDCIEKPYTMSKLGLAVKKQLQDP